MVDDRSSPLHYSTLSNVLYWLNNKDILQVHIIYSFSIKYLILYESRK